MKSLDEIRHIKQEVEAKLMNLPGVTGVDVGYKYICGKKSDILAIRVYVKEKKVTPEEEAIPREIQGIPTDVIERRFVLHSNKKQSCKKNSTPSERYVCRK